MSPISSYFTLPPPSYKKLIILFFHLGLGLALLTFYLARPNSIAIAGVRDPNHKTSQALLELSKGEGSQLIIVKIDNTSETDAATAVEILQSKHHITSLDVCIPFTPF